MSKKQITQTIDTYYLVIFTLSFVTAASCLSLMCKFTFDFEQKLLKAPILRSTFVQISKKQLYHGCFLDVFYVLWFVDYTW